MVSLIRWLFFSRTGKYGLAIAGVLLVTGFVWKHGYDTRLDAERERRLKAIAESHERRADIEDEVSGNSMRDLCNRLGGGVHCEEF